MARFPALALILALVAPPAFAETRQQVQFDFEVRGLTVAVLRWSAVETASSYAVTGTIQSTGLAGAIRKMRYDATVRGSVTSRGFAPQRYEQTGGSGKRVTEEVVVWRSGLPVIERQSPPREARDTDADPTKQRGTVDTLTALYATLRDVAPGQECRSSVIIYDGRYRMQLRLSRPQAVEGGVRCNGEYIRLAGFSPEDMAERTTFPFTLTYQGQAEGKMRVVDVTMDSTFGRARLVRK